MIKCENISKNYNGKVILKNINVEFEVGKITVLIGPSGSGKTSLLNTLSLLESPDSGRVILDNAAYDFPSNKNKIRNQFKFNDGQLVGVVFQNLDLQRHWTNRQNILKPLGSEIGEKYLSQLDLLIEKFKMHAFIDIYPSQCSKGEQQRIAFVRAVMLKPKYLFLDEITSALDIELIAILFRFLLELKADGVGVFLITHFLSSVQNIADEVIFIDNGIIVERGTSEIMKLPQSKELSEFLNNLKGVIIN